MCVRDLINQPCVICKPHPQGFPIPQSLHHTIPCSPEPQLSPKSRDVSPTATFSMALPHPTQPRAPTRTYKGYKLVQLWLSILKLP